MTRRKPPDLRGRTAIVTGANSGIGRAAAEALVKAGASVVLACRDPKRGEEARRALAAFGSVTLEALDLSDLSSVRSFAGRFLASHERLDLLINNAGVMAVPEGRTQDGFELQLGINHLGHFALTGLVFGALVRAGASRVVTVSSLQGFLGSIDFDDLDWHRGYDRWAAYQRSKLANLLFTTELARRIEAKGLPVLAVACHPGTSDTPLHAGPVSGKVSPVNRVMSVAGQVFGQPPAWGALPTIYAATSPKVRADDLIGPGLIVWGPPIRHPRPRWTNDAKVARRLWEESERMTGVTFPGL